MCAGLPGWMWINSICFSFAQLSSLWEINSGPLSMRICFGLARQSSSSSKTRTTRSAGNEVSTSIHSAWRLKSSMMFKVRKVLPLDRLSLIKSRDQVWLDCMGTTNASALLAASRFFGFLCKFSAKSRYTLRMRL